MISRVKKDIRKNHSKRLEKGKWSPHRSALLRQWLSLRIFLCFYTASFVRTRCPLYNQISFQFYAVNHFVQFAFLSDTANGAVIAVIHSLFNIAGIFKRRKKRSKFRYICKRLYSAAHAFHSKHKHCKPNQNGSSVSGDYGAKYRNLCHSVAFRCRGKQECKKGIFGTSLF